MKRSLPIVLAVSMCLGMVATTASASNTITITGGLDAATCTVGGGQGLNGGATPNFTVNLPKISTGSLGSTKGDVAAEVPFSIELSGNGCTDGKTVTAYFHPLLANIDAASGTLKNTAPTGATDVSVQLLDGQKNDAPIDLAAYDVTQMGTETIVTNKAKLLYWAQYYNYLGSTPSAGAYTSSLQYDIDYR